MFKRLYKDKIRLVIKDWTGWDSSDITLYDGDIVTIKDNENIDECAVVTYEDGTVTIHFTTVMTVMPKKTMDQIRYSTLKSSPSASLHQGSHPHGRSKKIR